MRKTNFDLKIAIIKKFGRQCAAAEKLEIRETRLSQIIHGRATPTDRERAVLARVLGSDEFKF
jgi:hypothetical protein